MPCFTADGNTMYYVTGIGAGGLPQIYRVSLDGNGDPTGAGTRFMEGVSGEPSLTADGKTLYFVHPSISGSTVFDVDVYYITRP